MRGKQWTKEEVEKAREMLKDGLRYKEVGEKLGKSADAVRHGAERYGLMVRTRSPNGAWTEEELEALKRMLEEGKMTCHEIGEELGRSVSSVRSCARQRLNVKGPIGAKKKGIVYNATPTLCWTCARSSGRNMCSWAIAYVPVNGWNAVCGLTETKKTTYMVMECPQYEKEARA